MKMIRKSRMLIYIAVFLLTLFCSTTFAWLSVENNKNINTTLGGFTINVSVYNGHDEISSNNGIYFFNGLAQIDAEQLDNIYPSEGINDNKNYFEKINIKISISADIPCFVRFKILNEWSVTRKYVNFERVTTQVIFLYEDNFFPFELSDDFVIDKNTNYCYYKTLVNKNETLEFEVGVPNYNYSPKMSTAYFELCDVNLAVLVDVVQANRLYAVWGLEKLPGEEEN